LSSNLQYLTLKKWDKSQSPGLSLKKSKMKLTSCQRSAVRNNLPMNPNWQKSSMNHSGVFSEVRRAKFMIFDTNPFLVSTSSSSCKIHFKKPFKSTKIFTFLIKCATKHILWHVLRLKLLVQLFPSTLRFKGSVQIEL